MRDDENKKKRSARCGGEDTDTDDSARQGKNRILWLWLKHYILFLHSVIIADGNKNDGEKAGTKSNTEESSMSTATEQVTVDSSHVTSTPSFSMMADIENDAYTASQVTSNNSADRRPSLREDRADSESAASPDNNNDTSNIPPPVAGLMEQTTRLMGNRRPQSTVASRTRRPRPPQREPTLPGAVAVVGPDPPSVINDDYTLTPSTTDVVSITDNSTVAVSAQLAPNQEHIQQEIRNRDLEIEELRRAREFVTVAQAVAEQEEQEEEEATGIQKLYRNSRMQCMALSAVVLVIVGIVLTIVFTTNASDVPDPTPTTPAPTPPSSLVEMLSTVSMDSGEALSTPSTAQNEALNWLASNGNLESYSDEIKIQRHVLATLYYSTNGDSWTNNTGWLSDSDECGWYNGAAGGELCSSQGLVVGLDLSKNNLTGNIPAEVGLLSSSLGEYTEHH